MKNITMAEAFNFLWEKAAGTAEDRAMVRAVEALSQTLEEDAENAKTTYTFADCSKLVIKKMVRQSVFYEFEVETTEGGL